MVDPNHPIPAAAAGGKLFLIVGAAVLLFLGISPAGTFGNEPPAGRKDQVHIRGRVLDPQGQPKAGADVMVVSVFGQLAAATRTGAEGKFELAFPESSIEERPGMKRRDHACLVAKAPGCGPGWIRLGELAAQPEPVLRLVADLPIRGRIVDLEGRPVAGAKLRVLSAHGNDENNLDGLLKAARDQPTRVWVHNRDHMRYLPSKALVLPAAGLGGRKEGPGKDDERPVLTTDDEGRFELSGVGRERAVRVALSGPGIESTLFGIVTRPEIEAKWKRGQLSRETRMELESGAAVEMLYPATFNHFAGPSRPITGTVREQKTGRPLKGVRVSGRMRGTDNSAFTDTDEQGRYELRGLATQGTLQLRATPPGDLPYLAAERKEMKVTAASPPTETDFELVRGVVVRGRIIDGRTGEPADGWVSYYAFTDNPFVSKLPDGLAWETNYTKDGRFQVTVLPGPGFIGVQAGSKRYEAAKPEDFGRPFTSPENRGYWTASRGLVQPKEFHVVKVVDPEAGAGPIELDLVLRAGKQASGKLVDAQGRPVTGVRAIGLSALFFGDDLQGSEFAVTGIAEGQERTVIFRHRDRKLGAVVTFSGKEPKPVTVTLRPDATLTGRLVDAEGRPVPQAPVAVMSAGVGEWLRWRRQRERGEGFPAMEEPIKMGEGMTDADGRFRVTAIIPGVKCELLSAPPGAPGRRVIPSVLGAYTLRSGETRDLGDLSLPQTEGDEGKEGGQ